MLDFTPYALLRTGEHKRKCGTQPGTHIAGRSQSRSAPCGAARTHRAQRQLLRKQLIEPDTVP